MRWWALGVSSVSCLGLSCNWSIKVCGFGIWDFRVDEGLRGPRLSDGWRRFRSHVDGPGLFPSELKVGLGVCGWALSMKHFVDSWPVYQPNRDPTVVMRAIQDFAGSLSHRARCKGIALGLEPCDIENQALGIRASFLLV